MYFRTAVYSFTFKCKNCRKDIVMQTDPEHCAYAIVEGAVPYVTTGEDQQAWDPAHSDHLYNQVMYRMENRVDDKTSGQEQLPYLESLVRRQSRW
eukprot:CAMPEP_0201282568 /NCGR_PEP_ID=MMETSP1317-20130820/6045_1 /ASSEMBLY_ACC=CAM_ASM_000770 /TAXON_ID=187299 /ORGANISM="Undescribed Undescribed, Strain Undescribed" /LENGTH=94 /DNA_ID=CAMNT_0047595695 /DNA_START=101 /DNA_END=382 /DNA_ORIENTATION=+